MRVERGTQVRCAGGPRGWAATRNAAGGAVADAGNSGRRPSRTIGAGSTGAAGSSTALASITVQNGEGLKSGRCFAGVAGAGWAADSPKQIGMACIANRSTLRGTKAPVASWASKASRASTRPERAGTSRRGGRRTAVAIPFGFPAGWSSRNGISMPGNSRPAACCLIRPIRGGGSYRGVSYSASSQSAGSCAAASYQAATSGCARTASQ